MVTSNKVPEKKVVQMGDPNNSVVPQRTLLGEVNEHITCPLCRGYYIDATTIVECLHSFCRSCIIKHLKAKSYCPVCEMMINSAKPNIKPDKALQDIVYKLVPGLFQKEMERRQHFYSSRPGPAATATPEQRGEDTERIIFSPEDVISFSLEYADATDSDSISSKSSDSNEPTTPATTRRYLQCPAVVNISHLKKFLCMKFDIDNSQFAIDILYKRVPLPDYYTLMDIAYIYNWKRNEPMRFFYQIIDYVAIRNRIFDINRKGSHFHDNKPSPAPTEETSVNSPALNLDQGSETSSGTDSPMPEENHMKPPADVKKNYKENKKNEQTEKNSSHKSNPTKKTEDEVEKSQFLNSFELTPKSNCVQKTSPVKPSCADEPVVSTDTGSKTQSNLPITEDKQQNDSLKRKYQLPPNTPELKKLKIELEKTKITQYLGSAATTSSPSTPATPFKPKDSVARTKEVESSKSSPGKMLGNVPSTSFPSKEIKQQQLPPVQPHIADSSGIKRSVPQHVATSKRKTDMPPPAHQQSTTQKTISPLKIQVPKVEISRNPDQNSQSQKPSMKRIPDLKPSTPIQNKPPINKVRMDLLANNSDPTIDRSKILSQVKTSLSSPNITNASGDPLKSLFDSCKINIPSSLSITLTDQKLDQRNPADATIADSKKNIINKNLAGVNNTFSHKVPSPPVHNYIEILKLPDNDSKKSNKNETSNDSKHNPQTNKIDSPVPTKIGNKSSETSAKGPVPNLKPISDTKLAKQSANYPITFQQTFEQQLQSLQGDKKSKGPKNKAQVPKLVPVPSTPKAFSTANKSSTFSNKPQQTNVENKTSTALDLSSSHNMQSPTGPPQNLEKTFETMQSIANLAKKQTIPQKGMTPSITQSPSFPSMSNRTITTGAAPLRVPSTTNLSQNKHEKSTSGNQINNMRQEPHKHNSMKTGITQSPTATPPNYQMSLHSSPSTAQPSPRQIRSPSSSPKLVIAEDKHASNAALDHNINQSNQISSTQLSSSMGSKSEPPNAVAGPSKPAMKTLKPMIPPSKLIPNRQPITPTMKPNISNMMPADYNMYTHSALMRHQLEMNSLAWMKQRPQYNLDFLKTMTNIAHQSQNDFNKDKP